MPRSQSGQTRSRRSAVSDSGEVDGALREAKAKLALLKQQLADLSDAVSYASDGSRENPLDSLPEGNSRILEKPAVNSATRYPSDESGALSMSRSSKGGQNRSGDHPPLNLLYKGVVNEVNCGNMSPRRPDMEPHSNSMSGIHENRIDEVRSGSANSGSVDAGGQRIISPFARFSAVDFERNIDVDQEAEEQRQAAIDRDAMRRNGGRIEDSDEEDYDEDDDDEVFHSAREEHFHDQDSYSSSKKGYRSPSPDEAAVPQTPVRSGETLSNAGARTHSERLRFEDVAIRRMAQNELYPGDTRGSFQPSHMEQSGQAMSNDPTAHGFGPLPVAGPPETEDDFESDAIAWILWSLGSYISWPGKEKQQHSHLDASLQSRFGVREFEPPVSSAPKVSPRSRKVRDAIAKRWSDGGVIVVEELWEMIAGIIENQDANRGLDAQSCWFSGRSLYCAADGLPFAFMVHTFSAPGMPCTVGRANVSAEVCCPDTARTPKCIASGEHAEEAEMAERPLSPRGDGSDADIRTSLSAQIVTGHIIGTHSSLEQKPAVVVDNSLKHQSSLEVKSGQLDSEEIWDVSLNPRRHQGNIEEQMKVLQQQQQPFTPRRFKGDEIFSFHSGSSKGSRAERSDKQKADQLATADLTAFIRGPDDASDPSGKGKHPYEANINSDDFESPDLSLFRDGNGSAGTESESLSFHNRAGSASMMSNEQFDTADLSGFVQRRGDRLSPVEEAEKGSPQLEPAQPNGPPSFAAADLVWEVRYLKAGDHRTAVIDMCFSPIEGEEELVSRPWGTYPGDSDSEGSARVPTLGEESGSSGRPGHSSKRSIDTEILRSVSLKGFLANQAEQRKNIRRKTNVETVAEIESVGSASSRKQMGHNDSFGNGKPGRPPLPRSSKSTVSDGDKPRKKPPVASGSRKELLEKEQRKSEKQRKARLPKFSKLVRRIRSLVGSRGSKSEFESVEAMDGTKGLRVSQSERLLPRPDTELRATRSAQLVVSVSDDEEEDLNDGSEGEGSEAHRGSEILRQMSIESIHPGESGLQVSGVVPGNELAESRGLEMVVSTHDTDSMQGPFWGFPKSVSLPVKDLGNGRYLIMGHLAGEGFYEISVKVGGKHVLESPVRFRVVPPRTLGSGITPDGPFYPHRDLPFFPSQTTSLLPHPKFPPCHSVSYDLERLEYARRHPHVGCVDLVFAVDATASMTAELEELPNVVRELSHLIGEVRLCKRVRFSVVAYRDHWPEDDHAFVLSKLDFTEDVEKVCNFILSLKASGGGDYPEAVEAALIEAAEGVSWWPFSSRLVIWVGDAPPHGFEGMGPKQVLEHEEAFLQAKHRVKRAEVVQHGDRSEATDSSVEARELKEARAECDKLAMYYDNFPLGVPGGVRWEEAAVRLAGIGARVIAIGLRDAIFHAPSQACLRSIAHLTGGALLEVGNLESSVVGPLTTAIVEQLLDQQLVEEEICDLMICCRSDLKRQPPHQCMKTIMDTMNMAGKMPHRLQVLPSESDESMVDSGDQVLPILHSDGGNSGHCGPPSMEMDKWTSGAGQSLLLGMQTVELRDKTLDQILKGIRSKAEGVGLALQAGFGSRSSWLETLGSGLGDAVQSQGRRAHKRIAEEVMTSPVALRYLLAEKCVAEILGRKMPSRQ